MSKSELVSILHPTLSCFWLEGIELKDEQLKVLPSICIVAAYRVEQIFMLPVPSIFVIYPVRMHRKGKVFGFVHLFVCHL